MKCHTTDPELVAHLFEALQTASTDPDLAVKRVVVGEEDGNVRYSLYDANGKRRDFVLQIWEVVL